MEKPSKPKAKQTVPVDDAVIDKEIASLFSDKKPVSQGTDQTIDNIMRSQSVGKVAVIVPMYGYWSDKPEGYLDSEILSAALNRVYSHAHSLYAILVAEPERMGPEITQTLSMKYVGGNVKGVRVPQGSSYGDYLREGIRVAMEETDASYFIVLNPWVVTQANGVDILVDRVNMDGNSPVICGYDMRGELTPDQFIEYKPNAAREKMMTNFNFMGLKRFMLEMAVLDPAYKTRTYLERDFFQTINSKGYTAVCSERVPIFSFEVPWDEYVPPEWYDEDEQYFIAKWHFKPSGIIHE